LAEYSFSYDASWVEVLIYNSNDDESLLRLPSLLRYFKGFEISKHFDRKLTKKIIPVVQIYSPAAHHMCLSSGKRTAFSLVLPFYRAILSKKYRRFFLFRIVLHHGTDKELLARLNEYGIQKESLDGSIGGTCAPTDYSRFIQTI
jgi:hypothetical protein